MRVIILLITIVSFCGCTVPKFYTTGNDSQKTINFTDTVQPVRNEKLSNYVIAHDDIESMPTMKIDLNYLESISPVDFFSLLSKMYKTSFVIAVQRKDFKLTIPKFNGPLKDLLAVLHRTYGLFFYRSGNTIIVKDKALCSIRLLYQDEEEQILTLVQDTFDADEVYVDKTKSAVVFNADSLKYKNIVEYFKSYPVTVVDLDVVFLEHELKDEADIGLDVQKFSANLDKSLSAATSLSLKGDNGFTLSLASGAVSMSAVLSSLEQYSKYSVLQRATISGLLGKQVVVDVSEKIPYVSEVTSSTGSTGAAVRGYKFDEVSSGMVLTININGDSDAIILKNELKYQNVTDFMNVGSGTDAFQRPTTSVRNISSYVTMRPGDVTKLASLRYKKISKSTSGLFGIPGLMRGDSSRTYEVDVLGRAVVKRFVFE